MSYPYNTGGAPQKESAATLAGHAATFGTTQHAKDNAAGSDQATQAEALRRGLVVRLNKLGLPVSMCEGESFLICGRLLDLRGAVYLARQLEGAK